VIANDHAALRRSFSSASSGPRDDPVDLPGPREGAIFVVLVGRARLLFHVLVCSVLGCSGGGTDPGPVASAGGSTTSGGNAGTPAGGASTSGGAANVGGSTGTQGGSTGTQGGSGGTTEAGGNTSSAGGGGAGESSTGSSAGGGGQTGPVTCRASGDGKSTMSFVNQCDGLLSFRGSDIEGGDLAPGEHACRDVGSDVEPISAIRFWGFIGMDPGGEKHTLAELTLNTDFNDFDWYNISHVDAHNLPMRIAPVDMPDCRVLTCAESLLENCPPEGRLEDGSGQLISCFSPMRDDPNSPVAQYFEASCDDAYSWSGDDAESMAACAGEDYDVIFCP